MKKSKNENLAVSSLYTAVFLHAKGIPLKSIDKQNQRSCIFVFKNSPEAAKLLNDFNFAAKGTLEIMVDPRDFIWSIKQLKEQIYQ
jgi:hypothetical protein